MESERNALDGGRSCRWEQCMSPAGELKNIAAILERAVIERISRT